MLNSVVNKLVSLARTSNMKQKHAAAILDGRRILAVGTNYSLPGCSIINGKIGRGGASNDVEFTSQFGSDWSKPLYEEQQCKQALL